VDNPKYQIAFDGTKKMCLILCIPAFEAIFSDLQNPYTSETTVVTKHRINIGDRILDRGIHAYSVLRNRK